MGFVPMLDLWWTSFGCVGMKGPQRLRPEFCYPGHCASSNSLKSPEGMVAFLESRSSGGRQLRPQVPQEAQALPKAPVGPTL